MNNNDSSNPAPLATRGSIRPEEAVAPLDATQLYGACHLLDADEMVAALSEHEARAMVLSDAPTAEPVAEIIRRMHATFDAAMAPAMPTPQHGHITDADAARDTLDEQADAATAGLVARMENEIAVLTEQRESLIRQNIALLNATAPFVAFDSGFGTDQAVYAVRRAQMLEDTGARCGFRAWRNDHGQIVGIDVGIIVAVAMAPVVAEMAVTDGGDVGGVEMEKAA